MVENCFLGDDFDILNFYFSFLGIFFNLNFFSFMFSFSVSSMYFLIDKDIVDKNGSIVNSNRMRYGFVNNLSGNKRSGSFKRKDSKKKVMEIIEN